MKILSVCEVPNYKEKICVILEDVFNNRQNGTSFNYAKAKVIPVDGIKGIAVGDEVSERYDRFGKLVAFAKVVK